MALRKIAIVVSKCLLIIILLACTQAAIAASELRLPGTYTSLTYNAESGDLIGYEVRLIPTSQGIKAVVQVAEGDAGRVYLVDVIEEAGAVRFAIPLASGKHSTFIGRVANGGLQGIITYPSGEHEDLFLKRGASYWDR